MEGIFLHLNIDERKKLDALATLAGFDKPHLYLKHLIKLQYEADYKKTNDFVNSIFGIVNALRQ